jgi:ketosteroid isomerase-like protein
MLFRVAFRGVLLCAVQLGLALAGQVSSSVPTSTSKNVDNDAIQWVLSAQQAAWNQGDVPVFMEGYWNSPQFTFAGNSGFTQGWQLVLARYLREYPNQTAMGHLDFSNLEIRPLGPDAALVLGKWHLKRPSGDVGGIFTLVFQRFPEGWRIIHDHTSVVAKPIP